MFVDIKKGSILCVVLLVVLVGCGSDNKATTPAAKIYRHSMDGVPITLDPAKSSDVYAGYLVVNIFDTLYAYKYLQRPYELKPNLATAMPQVSDDGLIYRIGIKPGVLFHPHSAFANGQREVLASDVVYSIKRIFDPKAKSSGKWLFKNKIVGLDDWQGDYSQMVAGLKVIDDHSFEIHLTQPYPQLIHVLANSFAAVVPREVVEATGETFGSEVIGSGPFKLVSFDTQKAVLERNPDFRQEPFDIATEGYTEAAYGWTGIAGLNNQSPPFVDRVEVNFFSDALSRWNSFTKDNEIQITSIRSGMLDKVLDAEGALLPQMQERYQIAKIEEFGMVYAGFNMDDPDFGYSEDAEQNSKNKALRCAIRDIYNWPQQNKIFYNNLGEAFPGVVPPMVDDSETPLSDMSITFNPDRARQGLQNAGITADQLPKFEYHINSGTKSRQLFEFLRGSLMELGYDMEDISIVPYPSFGAFNRAIKEKKVPFFLKSWALDYPDAQNTLQLFYSPNGAPGSNSFNYNNPAFDVLYEQTISILPSKQRTQLYQQMNQMVVDDCVAISGLVRNRVILWHDNVLTFPDMGVFGGYNLRYVALTD
ncbi:ABC transporter substrate-binding protein [Marinicella sp. W31]|uniref:ABC transporter substrate-binding protein n=1 Tax=Marinicella sp. W31 TaxID=3023713 RepID=UPI00375747DB